VTKLLNEVKKLSTPELIEQLRMVKNQHQSEEWQDALFREALSRILEWQRLP
jgi:hypothetical protein